MLKQGPEFHFEISEVEITRVDCNCIAGRLEQYVYILLDLEYANHELNYQKLRYKIIDPVISYKRLSCSNVDSVSPQHNAAQGNTDFSRRIKQYFQHIFYLCTNRQHRLLFRHILPRFISSPKYPEHWDGKMHAI